jgi:hypothetical protein
MHLSEANDYTSTWQWSALRGKDWPSNYTSMSQRPAWRPLDENVVFRFADCLPIFFVGLFSGSSDEDACNEHEGSAEPNLRGCGKHWRIHELVSHPCDDSELD